jgi:hypothetical protein
MQTDFDENGGRITFIAGSNIVEIEANSKIADL